MTLNRGNQSSRRAGVGSRVGAVPLWGWGTWGPWRVCRILCGSPGDSVWLEPHLSLSPSPLDGETSVPPRFSVLHTCGAPAVCGHVPASGSPSFLFHRQGRRAGHVHPLWERRRGRQPDSGEAASAGWAGEGVGPVGPQWPLEPGEPPSPDKGAAQVVRDGRFPVGAIVTA